MKTATFKSFYVLKLFMPRMIVPIKGMHCKSCEILLEAELKKVCRVERVEVNHKIGRAEVYFKDIPPDSEDIKKAVSDAGYTIGFNKKLSWFSRDPYAYKNLAYGAIILLFLFLLAKQFGLFNLVVNTDSASLLVVFVIGLVAGVSTCMALIGGLVLAISSRHAELHPEATARQKFRPHLYFNFGRVLGFGILGGISGALGSFIKPSFSAIGIVTIIVGAVMIFLGLKLLEIFPAIKNKTFTLPKFIAKIFGIRKEIKEYSHKSAFVSGALTFFLPCGFTQAMQLYAISTGSFFRGALIMSLFALGTAPGLLGIGGLSSIFKGNKAKIFFSAAGLAVILLGWFNITNGRLLIFHGKNNQPPSMGLETQEVRMTQSARGFSPNQFVVERGKKVRWIIDSSTALSCASSIVMPQYGISRSLEKGQNIIEFVPVEIGEIHFSCSMGMYRGKFNVVDK